VRDADVVLENFRPGTMERWSLGPDDVHRENPEAIYARVSGYGQTGRYRDRPGFASAGEAVAGLRHINGYPGQAPPRNGISLGDTLAAQSAFQGILLALYARDARGGAGQVIDASITDACFAVTESAVLEYEKTGWVREPTGPRLPRIAPSNVYRSSDDRWVVIAANHDTLWRRLAQLMGRPELGEDERFADHNARGENEDELDEVIGAWAAQHTAEELDRIVNEAGVVCARVYSAADVYADPYFRERELLVEHEDEVHGTVTVPGVVPKLSETPGGIRQPARWTVGADTEEVLGELGLGDGEIAGLREREIV
jgi:crotonobetainyl-CoA:carnitine CoA-transferase CaiB-like acyl-CoA transferase